jgi:hypothetical protein
MGHSTHRACGRGRRLANRRKADAKIRGGVIWVVAFGLVFAGGAAIAYLIGAFTGWSEEKVESLAGQLGCFILIGIALLLIGIYAFSSTSDWFKNIPGWAGVIIVLLVIIIFQLSDRK